jgi:16S rRNA (guanine1207-N2)-methyltransferase
VTYPGVFSRGALDDGTRLLITALPKWSGLSILDFAAGGGVISGHLARHGEDLKIYMLEADSVALEAAKQNVPTASAILSDAWALMPELKVDRIVSNPPIHFGKSEDFRVIRGLVESSPSYLNKAGELWMVVQRQVPAQTLFGTNWTVELAAENTRFRVWRGILKD